jgi:hypothetical protein
VQLRIEVSKETLPETQLQALVETIVSGGPYAPPVDLEILVTTERQGEETVLRFTLNSPNGAAELFGQEAGSQRIKGSPDEYQEHVMQKLEALARGKDVDGYPLNRKQVEDKLKALGHDLYTQLFSRELRAYYRKFHKRIRTLMIVTDEPWIPWELVKPYDTDDPNDLVDDEFLCVQFQMTRWSRGPRGPAGKMHITKRSWRSCLMM